MSEQLVSELPVSEFVGLNVPVPVSSLPDAEEGMDSMNSLLVSALES